MGAVGVECSGVRRGARFERRRAARRRRDRDQDRHRRGAIGGHVGVDGTYVFPNLPVGPYQLKVELQGFNTYQQDGIVLQVSSNPQLNVTLAVGIVSETVTVIANSAMVETHSTGIGQVVDNQRVVELPLNGRQATELIFLAGLATSAPAGDLNTNKNFPTVTISVAGGQANGMTYIMDGGTHNDPFNNLNLPTAFPDAMQEFKVETSSLPARYGHHAASAVNIITKSGTNDFKGSAFEFNRDYHFNAKNAFAATRDSLRRNTFGGVLGGPMIKNKAFFFGGYQGQIEKTNPPTSFSYIPTRAMLNGDFTAIASPACNGGTSAQPDRRLREQPDRSGAAQPDRQELCRVPAGRSGGSVRQGAVRHSPGQHGTSGADQGRLHAEQPAVPLYPVSLCGLRQPRDLRRQERADAQPDWPEQPGALGGGWPQLRAVVVRERAARHLQQDAQRSPAAGVLHRHRPGQQGLQPAARIHGHQRDRQRLRGRQRRHQSRLLRFG